jgi:formylglycine-generating enzyme required for sulfatase activity/uncharacterized protein YjdB
VETEDGKHTATCTVYVVVPVTGVTLDETRFDGVPIGWGSFIIATVSPNNATFRTVSWKCSDDTVLEIISPFEGYNNVCGFFGKKAGSATITVTTDDGGKTAPCAVTVIYVPVTGITLNQSTMTVAPGSTANLIATVLTEYASDKTVRWSTDNAAVADVAAKGTDYPDYLTGVVTGNGRGTANITVTSDDNPAWSATCLVSVVSPGDVASLTLNKHTLSLVSGDAETLVATRLPTTADNKTVSWVSSNEGTATVVNGKVTALAVGSTTITVTSNGDTTLTETCAVNVVASAPAIADFKWIPPGTFSMGSPDGEAGRNNNEGYRETEHQVTLSKGFYMGETEVTQGQYEAVMGAAMNDSQYPKADSPYLSRKMAFPVENVNWHEAIFYCNARSIKEGLTPAYTIYKANAPNADELEFFASGNPWVVSNWEDIPANWSTNPADWGAVPYDNTYASRRWGLARMVEGADGYRLPTEAEWEYACRANANPKTPWNTGTSLTSEQAKFSSALTGPVPVKMYQPNAWGLYDMHGNVAEWVFDWMADYPGGSQTDPSQGMFGFMAKRVRGGSFGHGTGNLRSASRAAESHFMPAYVQGQNLYSLYGFRVVRYVKQPAPSSSMAAPKTVIDAQSGTQGGKFFPRGMLDNNSAFVLEAIRRDYRLIGSE